MRSTSCLSLLAVMTLAGCGGSGLDLVAVSGTVEWEGGGPVSGATVTFMPESGGPSSTAITDDSGKFSLKTGTGQSGAVPGKHKITVSKPNAAQDMNFNNASSLEQMAAARGGSGGNARRGSPAPDMGANYDASIPKKYASAGDTPLSYEVGSGSGPVNLTIEKPQA